MATLKGKWRFNRELVFPEESVYAACVFKCGEVDFLSNPNDYNHAWGIIFNKQELRIQGSLIVYNKTWQSSYDYWSVIDFGNTDRIVSRKFYEIFTANANPIIEETVSVMYDGKEITNIGFGQTTTFNTKDTILKGDFSISVEKAVDVINISYGDEAPKDTTKLWVKCDKPIDITIQSDFNDLPDWNVYVDMKIKKSKETMPFAGEKFVCVEYNDNIYIFGWDYIYIFNTKENTLQHQIKMISNSYHQPYAAVVLNQTIYAFYSSGSSTYVYEFYPLTFSYGESKQLNIPMSVPSVAAVNNKIYLFGGITNADELSNTICVYDIEENSTQIIEGTSLYEAASEICAVTFNDKIYLFGGFIGFDYPQEGSNFHTSPFSDKFYVFDPSNNTLEQISVGNWGEPRGFDADFGVVKGEEIHLFGRMGGAINPLIFAYNPNSGFCSYNYSGLNLTRTGGAVANNTVYIFGGRTYTSGTYDSEDNYNVYCAKSTYRVPRGKLILLNKGGKKTTIIKNNNLEINADIKTALVGDINEFGYEVKFAVYENGEWVEYEDDWIEIE